MATPTFTRRIKKLIMSTKATIVYDEDFHFYLEAGDQRHVYLQLKGAHFEAGYNRIMVPIPISVWEVIRKHGAADLSLAGKADAELLALVEAAIENRIAEYERHHRGGEGVLLFGPSSTPREQQIARGMERYREMRREQEEIQSEIAEIEAKNVRVEGPVTKRERE